MWLCPLMRRTYWDAAGQEGVCWDRCKELSVPQIDNNLTAVSRWTRCQHTWGLRERVKCVSVCVCDHTCMSVCHTCWYVSRLVVYAKALWLVRHIEAWRPLLSAAYWAVICQTFVSPLSPSAVKGAQSLSETRWHPPTTSTHYNNFSCQCNKAGYGMKWDAVLGVWKYDKVE